MKNPLPHFLRDLLSSPPPAGQGVHSWLFRVARQLHPHYPDKTEMARLLEAAVYGCGRHVSRKEIEDAIANSESVAWKPDGHQPPAKPKWPKPNLEQIEAIATHGPRLADLWEASPIRLEDNRQPTESLIDCLFPDNPLLCCGKFDYNFDTRLREQWRGELSSLQLIVPNPMSAIWGHTQGGKPSKHSLENTGPRRYLVIECDFSIFARDGQTETQFAPLIRKLQADGIDVADMCASVLLHLAGFGPLVCALHSGGKSLHGWFYCAGQPEEHLKRFMRYAVSLGADDATWTRSQFVRMPDGLRDNGKLQTVFYFNPQILEANP